MSRFQQLREESDAGLKSGTLTYPAPMLYLASSAAPIHGPEAGGTAWVKIETGGPCPYAGLTLHFQAQYCGSYRASLLVVPVSIPLLASP